MSAFLSSYFSVTSQVKRATIKEIEDAEGRGQYVGQTLQMKSSEEARSLSRPRFLIHGFSVGLRANAETGTWGVLRDKGSMVDIPPLVRKLRERR